MSEAAVTQVKIKVRPQQQVDFPGVCVHCSRPAAEPMPIRKRIGRVTRVIDVPVCVDCARRLQQQSGEEERLQKLGWVASGTAVLLVTVIAALLLPAGLGWGLRLFVALALALLLGGAVWLTFRRAGARAMLPEKKAIRDSAAIAAFSWRATTFDFANETFAERFRELNEPLLMET